MGARSRAGFARFAFGRARFRALCAELELTPSTRHESVSGVLRSMAWLSRGRLGVGQRGQWRVELDLCARSWAYRTAVVVGAPELVPGHPRLMLLEHRGPVLLGHSRIVRAPRKRKFRIDREAEVAERLFGPAAYAALEAFPRRVSLIHFEPSSVLIEWRGRERAAEIYEQAFGVGRLLELAARSAQ